MIHPELALPLLPLVLDRPPFELCRALEQEGIPFCVHAPGSPAGRFVLASGRAGCAFPLQNGQCLVDLDEVVECLGDDPWRQLADTRSRRAQWTLGPLPVREEVSLVDKRDVRRRLMAALREAIERRGGVWLKVGSCPFPYRAAFCLRIDHDDYHTEDFHALLHALRGQERAVSHYVCAADFVRHPEALARLRGWHVGGHGFHHHTYADYEQNLRNISRGWQVLERAGLAPDGFVAPHGRYSAALGEVLKNLGVSHSSEFGLAYDDAPFEPSPGGVLQIPVHPVCLGVVLEAAESCGMAAAAVIEPATRYFEQWIANRYEDGEPVLLYDHPTGRWGRYPQIVRAMLAAARNCGLLWRATMAEQALWWRARQKISLRVLRDGDEYVVFANGLPSNYQVAVEYWRGEHVAQMPLAETVLRFAPSALAYQRRGQRPRFQPVRVDRAEGLRGHVKRFLDWEKSTPIEEINASTVSGWMKRTLRRWQG
ncbi:MAG: DUF2334 domain-containing protein [Planctomycetia bacterium]|nr:DUF2334 domain-containing protein [Planctomycetia bacterium]